MASSNVMMTSPSSTLKKTVDEVWREIVSGHRTFKTERESDHQNKDNSEMMTLEDFLLRAGAADSTEPTVSVPSVKLEPRPMSSTTGGGGSFGLGTSGDWSGEWSGGTEMIVGRGKRRGDSAAAEQRHRRMIKNRESAARSRERKQAYQAELESLAVKLEEENEKLMKEKAARTKERLNQLMERVVPVIEQRKPTRSLRRIHSMQW